VQHFIHVDEFQSFTTDAFASIFSEARKFATYFCLANQYTKQMPEASRSRESSQATRRSCSFSIRSATLLRPISSLMRAASSLNRCA
jgi:tRNA isopentenyl-2-thiomethyl-A-37 hydroxylase MiaE